MKTCPRCGFDQIKDKDALCSRCGVYLAQVNDQALFATATVKLQKALDAYFAEKSVVGKLASGEVALHLIEADEIVKFTYRRPVLLGRGSKNRSQNIDFVNMGDYDGYSKGMSRSHAMIRRVDDQYSIADLGSSNGTAVNGERLTAKKWHPLQNGTRIALGGLMFVFYSGLQSEN